MTKEARKAGRSGGARRSYGARKGVRTTPTVTPSPASVAPAIDDVHHGQRICRKCGAANLPNAEVCVTCGGNRLAPTWVLARREVTKYFEVQITRSSERFGQPVRRITLSKWWPGSGDRSPSLHIPTPEQWGRVRDIVEGDFGRQLGWRVLGTRSRLPVAPLTKDDLLELMRQYPDLAREVVGDDLNAARERSTPEEVARTDGKARAATTPDRDLVPAYRRLIKQLPNESAEALAELEQLLMSWSLHQITRVTAEIRRRLDLIELFEELVMNDKTYELKGERSIHRTLESAMWIVDERYWLMSSNRTLRTLIGGTVAKERRRDTSLRPDFACAQLLTEGVLVELKRPAHPLTPADLNQAERYLILAERFAPAVRWRAILIGQKATDETMRTAKFRTAVTVQTFAELLADARHRYKEYLKIATPGTAGPKSNSADTKSL
jgi:ribosomal protein L40E